MDGKGGGLRVDPSHTTPGRYRSWSAAIAHRDDRSHGLAVTSESESNAMAMSASLQIQIWGEENHGPGVCLPGSVIDATTYIDVLTSEGMNVSSWSERA